MDGLAGTGVPHDVSLLAAALTDGDWVEASLHGLSGGLGVVGAVTDPVAALSAAGAGWALEHVGPLRDMLDDLAGDPAAVAADADRLEEASREVAVAVEDATAATVRRLEELQGHAVDAARRFSRQSGEDGAALSELLGAAGWAVQRASGVVATVRNLVRDGIAELVGMAVSSGVTAVATAGLGAAVAIMRVTARASSLCERLGLLMSALVRSFDGLRRLLARAEAVLDDLVRRIGARRPVQVPVQGEGLPGSWASGLATRLRHVRVSAEVAQAAASGAATGVSGPGAP